MRIAAHEHDFERGEVEGEVRILRDDRHPPRHDDLATRAGRSSSSTLPCEGWRVPASSRSNVVFPEPLGPRIPTKPLAGTSSETPLSTGAASGRYEKVTSAARSNPQPHHSGSAQRRVAQRFLVASSNRFSTRPKSWRRFQNAQDAPISQTL